MGGNVDMDFDFLNYQFSSKTLQYLVDEQSKTLSSSSENEIFALIKNIIDAGMQTDMSGSEIKQAVNEKRESVLSNSFKKLSEKIIKDVLIIEKEKLNFSKFTLEDIILAAKITKLLKENNSKECSSLLASILPENSMVKPYNKVQNDEIEDMFIESDSGVLILLDMYYDSFYNSRKINKTMINAPIFESLISYI